SLYNVSKVPVRLPFRSNYGGIDELGGKLLLVDRQGPAWLLDDNYKAEQLSFTVPTNTEEYVASQIAFEKLEPYRQNWTGRSQARFGVRDILVVPDPDGATLWASYFRWYEAEACLTVNVAGLALNLDGTPRQSASAWQHVYESTPCLGLDEDDGYLWMEDGGGRIVQFDDHRLLLTIGDFGYDGMKSKGKLRPQLDDNHYGKIILIDLNGGAAQIHTKGHRNPQGLVVAADGQIYSTEHGPVGGDELNLITAGANYGWPVVSYGRTCIEAGSCTDDDGLSGNSRLNWNIGEHAGDFQRPIYSWVPSIGISNLIAVRGTLFERWKDDLLVSSLKQKTLYRVRLRDGRAAFAEPVINLGRRIRDLIEMSDGRIILKPDSNVLFVLTPDISRRTNVIAQCSACHTFMQGQPHGIGPNLWGVFGSATAAQPGFEYSAALSAAKTTWTREKLAEFLSNPQSFAPGSSMVYEMQSAEDVEVAIDFLESLND
ncbi:MAG: PQQ-dependent sugar dehydrogenase, partial [Pseudomonadota bacterium]